MRQSQQDRGWGRQGLIYIHTDRHIYTHTCIWRERGDYLSIHIIPREIYLKELVHVNVEDGKSKFCRAGGRPREELIPQPKSKCNLHLDSMKAGSSPHTSLSFLFVWIIFCFVLAVLRGTWDLSSLTRDRTHSPCSGSTAS